MIEINNVNNNQNEKISFNDYNTKSTKSKPNLFIKHIHTNSQNKSKYLRKRPDKMTILRRLNQIEDICQKIYTNSNTPNQTKNIEYEIYRTKLKSINDITNNYSAKKSSNYLLNLKTENNRNFKKLISLNKNKMKNKRCISREKEAYITEQINKNDNLESYGNAKIIKRNVESYGRNIVLKHPQIYKLSNKRNYNVSKLPKINGSYIKINTPKKFTKLIPDKDIKPEDYLEKYDFYEKIKKMKKNMSKYAI